MSEMYPWITEKGETWNPLAGVCPHHCSYCYVNDMKARFPVLREKYSGDIRLDEKAMKKRFKPGDTVFVCSMNDLFAEGVPDEYIYEILDYTREFKGTTFLFQTKNPKRMKRYFDLIPDGSILGTTIETDCWTALKDRTDAPAIWERVYWMEEIRFKTVAEKERNIKLMVSIEPVIVFDPDFMYAIIDKILPDFVSIGADSKSHNLPEPDAEDIKKLVGGLIYEGYDVRMKENLKRIIGEEAFANESD